MWSAEAAERAAAKQSGDLCRAYLKEAQEYRELARACGDRGSGGKHYPNLVWRKALRQARELEGCFAPPPDK
jgi:hypothetical protein